MKRLLGIVGAGCCFLSCAFGETKVWLDEMDLGLMSTSYGTSQRNLSVEKRPLRIFTTNFKRGVGTHAISVLNLEIKNALSFDAMVGIDAEKLNSGDGTVQFTVTADKKVVADSGVVGKRKGPVALHADLRGAKVVILQVLDGGDGIDSDHADWCDAYFTLADGGYVRPLDTELTDQLGILTPPAPATPRINGPKVFGARPGHPILFTVPVTGDRPMAYSAKGLPEGVTLDPASGILTGSVTRPGDYSIVFTAKNAKGESSRPFTLSIGKRIALTPPMGWNSWNCFAGNVSDEKIRSAARAMYDSGLLNHGWLYINIDDYWENRPGSSDPTLQGPARDADGRIVTNKRFPDMKGLADYVHGLGMKIGLYSSPGPLTCGGCVASWQHEMQDAQSYAEWGFDYLKYDWCSYGTVAKKKGGAEIKYLMKPYSLMGKCLLAQNRDIVFSLCQYGMGNVSAWGDKVNGNCWRTTGDITDTWNSMAAIVDKQDGLEVFSGPGNWNDPDMLIVGKVGWGYPHPSRLTPNEQYTHISLWCLFSSPLLIGCDMTQLDPFTLNLLTNDEVLEVNQDPLGNAAGRIFRDSDIEIWAKKMLDGSTVVGIVNRSLFETKATFNFSDAGLKGAQRMRDLWRQQDIGIAQNAYSTVLFRHACQLIRLWPAK